MPRPGVRSRRSPIGLLAGVALVLCACTPEPPATPRRPNVLILVADDLGFSDIGALGGEIPTPNVDALAEGGVLMTNFHVAATCSPTRSMLLSGVDSHRAGLGNMGEFLTDAQRGRPGYEGHLSPRVRTIAERLRDAGYATAMFGKWHLGDEPQQRPHARGFDRSFALLEGSGSAWSDGSPAPLVGERTHFTRDGEPVERGSGFSATRYVDEALRFLDDRADDRPFLIYLAFQAVHWPHHAPDAFLERARGRYDAGWHAVQQARIERQRALGILPAGLPAAPLGDAVPAWTALSEAERRDQIARMEAYAAMAMAMDFEIGRLLQRLREGGELDETLVLFLSDNGADPSAPERSPQARPWYAQRYPKTAPDDLGRPGSFPSTGYAWARVSVTPFAGHKGGPLEGGLRVPLIARLPGPIAAGQRSEALGYATDLVPTILEAAGVPAKDAERDDPSAIDGRSLWSVMTGEAAAARGPEEIVGYELMGNSALFRGDLKLIRLHGRPWQLFDLRRDPGETSDLAQREPARLREMLEDYARWEESMGVIPVPADYDVMQQMLRTRSDAGGS